MKKPTNNIAIKEKEYRRALSPCILNAENKGYRSVEELQHAVNLSNCCNIALTGVYGSGKSSVIKTFLSKNTGKKTLRISLSTFEDEIEDGYENQTENRVEYKIFQHILYKSNPNKTSQSKYKRISYLSYHRTVYITIAILIFLIFCITVFEPKTFRIPSFYKLYFFILGDKIGNIVNVIGDFIGCLYFLLILGYCLYHLIRKFHKFNISDIKAKDFEVTFEDKKFVLDDLLEEILYFFKAGEYDYVVFEDLDRINNPRHLFLKFREINIMLNESEYYISHKKQIRFIYAIKDDIFKEEIRTKCFDYIIPIVPIVDKFNAGDYLIKYYKATILDGIDEKDLSNLGLYITTMRELTNVINEFGIYKDTVLQGEMSKKKLFAMIIYKNLFPHDYSLIHQKEGCLYNLFAQKEKYDSILTDDDKKQLSTIENNIEQVKENIRMIRLKVLGFLEHEYNIVKLIIDGTSYPLSDFEAKDSLYARFENNRIDKYYYENGDECGTLTYNIKFKDLLVNLDYDGTYNELMFSEDHNLSVLVDSRTTCQNKIRLIENNSLLEIIKKINNGEMTLKITKGICLEVTKTELDLEKIAATIHALVRNGYIAEDFEDYISYYYPGSKKNQDFTFLHSVLQGISLPYDYQLTNAKEVVKALHTDNFLNKECLNFFLLDYIIESKDHATRDVFIKTARNFPDFVVKYYKLGNANQKFFNYLFINWNNCINQIMDKAMDEDRSVMYELLFIVAPDSIELKGDEIIILNRMYEFITARIRKIDMNRLKVFIKNLNLKFEKLNTPDNQTNALFNFIITSNSFVINEQNLTIIYGEDFITKSFSAIMSGEEAVFEYLEKNICDVVDLFPDTDVNENIEAIVKLSNDMRVSEKQLLKFLTRQTAIIDNFEEINKERFSLYFKTDKIKPTWKNIERLFPVEASKDILIPFIVKHVHELSTDTLEEDEVLQELLFTDNTTLPYEVFKRLLPCYTHNFTVDEISNLDEDRLKLVINTDNLEYNKEFNAFFATTSATIYGDYLIHFFDKFIFDEDFNGTISNAVGIKILNSNLTLDQKKYFLDNVASILADSDSQGYSRLICFYYNEIGVHEGMNIRLLISSMNQWNEVGSWQAKISLINGVNSVFCYNETTETAMLHSLGEGYLQLSSYRGVSHFDDNTENRTLLYYLQKQGHYVNKIKENNGKLKVTYKNSPQG